MPESVRADVWVWAVRLAKTRTQATDACKAGHVRVRGERAKPSTPVRVGDTVIVRTHERERIVVATKLLLKRVGAAPAAEAYEDHSPPPPKKEHVGAFGVRDRGAGKPTKRERRQLDRLRRRPSR